MKTKKMVLISVIFLITLGMLTGCFPSYSNSLNEYIQGLEHGIGESSVEVDDPYSLLPSLTFLSDFEYINGAYHLYESGLFGDKPERALLVIEYDQEVYESAKAYMLENLEPFGNKFYVYNDYYFYDNNDYLYKKSLSDWFTAACYNDEKQVLCFLGFCDVYHYDFHEKYEYGKEEKWPEFIDQYYGEWYDFSK